MRPRAWEAEEASAGPMWGWRAGRATPLLVPEQGHGGGFAGCGWVSEEARGQWGGRERVVEVGLLQIRAANDEEVVGPDGASGSGADPCGNRERWEVSGEERARGRRRRRATGSGTCLEVAGDGRYEEAGRQGLRREAAESGAWEERSGRSSGQRHARGGAGQATAVIRSRWALDGLQRARRDGRLEGGDVVAQEWMGQLR